MPVHTIFEPHRPPPNSAQPEDHAPPPYKNHRGLFSGETEPESSAGGPLVRQGPGERCRAETNDSVKILPVQWWDPLSHSPALLPA